MSKTRFHFVGQSNGKGPSRPSAYILIQSMNSGKDSAAGLEWPAFD